MEMQFAAELRLRPDSDSVGVYVLPERPVTVRYQEETFFKMFWTQWGVRRFLRSIATEYPTSDDWTITLLDIKRHLFRFSVTLMVGREH